MTLMAWITFSTSVSPPKIDVESIRESRCMANAIFYEARGEGMSGRKAVFDVVMNRSNKNKRSICSVMSEKNAFSWYSKQPLKPISNEMRKLLTETANARTILSSNYYNFYSGKRPSWASSMLCRRIGNQHFCKEKK